MRAAVQLPPIQPARRGTHLAGEREAGCRILYWHIHWALATMANELQPLAA